MARAPQVTRTIKTTRVNVLCLDITSAESLNMEFVLPRTYKDVNAMLKAVKKECSGENIKPVHVIDYCIEKKLYGMSEAEFIKLARELPPREAKENEV